MRARNLVFLAFLVGAGLVISKTFLGFNNCANSRSCEESLKLNVDNNDAATFAGEKIVPPKIDLAEKLPAKTVLGEVDNGQKHIYVDLSTQTLRAFEGEKLFMEAKVSTGKWGKTPTGDFRIWEKLRATKMSGGSGADYYYLPNVPFVMFFSNDEVSAGRGFSLHGAYWHNNFGYPMSHGCVNMRIIDAEKLYWWVGPQASTNVTVSSSENPGTLITIYGQAPI